MLEGGTLPESVRYLEDYHFLHQGEGIPNLQRKSALIQSDPFILATNILQPVLNILRVIYFWKEKYGGGVIKSFMTKL